MTGYGRAQDILEGRDITVEIRSVNHRFFELSVHVPKNFACIEEKAKTLIKSLAHRGKIEANISVVNLQSSDSLVEINEDLAMRYIGALRAFGKSQDIPDDLSLSSISRFSDIFVSRKSAPNEDSIWKLVSAVLLQALHNFLEMRQTEGESLKRDIAARLDFIAEGAEFIKRRSPMTVQEYRGRLYSKIKEVLEDRAVDEARIVTETAIFADKIDTAEENVRLISHIEQFRAFLEQDGAVGRKLDFLLQEMNREINTIASKSQDLDIARRVVELKAELEKIREQAQNIE
ncbi:MAG: YicC family protein [Oscillospiraceae bacterium]|jgi:uncharacterized protein (TIGR00255 family)|nr:YicC family protein [Oscillospiraceae bacterium]